MKGERDEKFYRSLIPVERTTAAVFDNDATRFLFCLMMTPDFLKLLLLYYLPFNLIW